MGNFIIAMERIGDEQGIFNQSKTFNSPGIEVSLQGKYNLQQFPVIKQ